MTNRVTIRALRILADQYHRVHRRLDDGFCQRCSTTWPCEHAEAADDLDRLAQALADRADLAGVTPPIDGAILQCMRRIAEAIPEPQYGPHDCGKIGG
jgi:hypothetical protein